MSKYVLLIIAALQLGCASNSVNVTHYMLNNSDTAQAQAYQGEKAIIRLRQVSVAEYLQHANLVMQISDNQLYYSPQDVWAEPLPEAISKALTKDLNQQSEDYYFLSYDAPMMDGVVAELAIRIDHFHPTRDGRVVADGMYWIVAKHDALADHAVPFAVETSLQQDGYSHSTEQSRLLVNQLAGRIQQSLSDPR